MTTTIKKQRQSGLLGSVALGALGSETGCEEKSGYGMSCKDRRKSDGTCCCTSWFMLTEGQCESRLANLENYCGTDVEALRQEYMDACCYYDEIYEDLRTAQPPEPWSAGDCAGLIDEMEAGCGDEREDSRAEFRQHCCGHPDLVEEEQGIIDGAYLPCGGGGGGGGGSGGGGGGASSGGNTSNNNPYSCGTSDEDMSLAERALDILGNLADKGMCAGWNETCDQKKDSEGADQSVYCCRQVININTSGEQDEQVSGSALLGVLGATSDETSPSGGQEQYSACSTGNAPPPWVPGFLPAGYTPSQYAQFLALLGIGSLGAALLLGALFGGDDEDEQQQPVVVVTGATAPVATAPQTQRQITRGKAMQPASTAPASTAPAGGGQTTT